MLIRLLPGVALLLSLVNTAAAEQDAGASVYLRHSSTFYSEPAPLDLLLNELEGGQLPGEGKNAVTFNRIELGFTYRAIEFGLFAREDYAFHFTSDTFKFIYMDKNDIGFPDNSAFAINLEAQHVKLQGLRLAYRVEPTAWSQISVALNYFEASDVLFGRISGHLGLEDGRVAGELDVAYYSDKDYLFKKDLTAPEPARGHSLDLGLQLQLVRGISLAFTAYDLFGRLQWRDAPYTEAAVSSSTLYYDDAGKLRRAPVMSGLKDYRNVEQTLPRHWQLELNGPIGDKWAWSLAAERYDEVLFQRAFLYYTFARQLELIGGYDLTADAPWFGVRTGRISLNIASDDTNLSESQALMVSLSAYWRF